MNLKKAVKSYSFDIAGYVKSITSDAYDSTVFSKLKIFSFIKNGLFILCCLCIQGCVNNLKVPSPFMRGEHALKLAKAVGWKAQTIPTSHFTFKTYMPSAIKGSDTLRIYLEGDGFAWRDIETPSDNPTPITPVALQLAIEDRGYQRVVYLARPCQYVFGDNWGSCREDYWTHLRFSPEVIEATNQAVTILKKRWGAKKITLIGYSGGGAIALLVAERRTDVVKLITVAGVLDTQSWVKELGLRPLYGSLNPADQWEKLKLIPQVHWVGQEDKVVPKEVANAYVNRFSPDNKPEVRVVPNFDHACCWARDWLKLLYFARSQNTDFGARR